MVQPIDETLAALAHPIRRAIVGRLARGTATVSELVDGFELTQPTISSHLKVLERSGLISRSRVAQTRPCKLELEALTNLSVWLGDLRSIYEANYDRLDDVLERLKAEKKPKAQMKRSKP